jgi:hypothetical protein
MSMGLSSQTYNKKLDHPCIPLVPCVMFNSNKQIGKETWPTPKPNVIAVIYDFS